MKAFLLAAGLGIRLRPLTDKIPKCLLPIAGVPLLSWWIQALSSIGVREVLVNTHHLADQIHSWARTQPLAVTVFHEPTLLGSSGTVRANRSFVGDADSFLIIYADMWVRTDLGLLSKKHSMHSAPLTLGVYPATVPRESGIATLSEADVVLEFEEKPANPKSEWANAGIMVARTALFDYIPDLPFSDLSQHVLPRLVGKMVAHRMRGVFQDIGTPLRYAEAQVLALQDGSGALSSETGNAIQTE